MSSGRSQANVLALRTAGIYLIVGLLWIVLSDWAVRAISHNLQTASRLQTAKGWLFVVASFSMLYFIVKRHISSLLDSQEEAKKTLRQSAAERRELEFIIGRSPAVAFLWRAAEGWPVEYVSESVRQFGYTPEDFYSGRIQFPSIIHPDDLQRVTDEVASRDQREDCVQSSQEYRLISPSGRVHWVDDRTWVRRNNEGKITHYQGILLDITERKRAEETLMETQNLLNDVGRIAKIGGWRMDLLTRKATWTLATYEIAEIAPGTPPPGPDEHVNYYLPEYRPMVAEAMRALIEENRPLDFEAELRTAKGNIKWCHAIGKAIRRCGKAIVVYGTFQDISERKRAEETLRQSAAKRRELEFIIGRSPAVAFLWRAGEGWPVEYVSENVRQFGYTPEDFYSGRIGFASIVHPDDLQRVTDEVAIRARREDCVQFSQEYRLISPSGHVHWVDDRTWVRRNDQGEITHYQGILLDITERKQTEEALRNSEKRFRSIFEGAAEGILVADAESQTFRYANPSICRMLGYTSEELLRISVADIHPPKDLPSVLETFKAQARGDIRLGTDMPCLRKDGTVFYADINTAKLDLDGRPCLAGFFSDATERRLLETQLRQAQKMEAVGQLAGGVAHDFNNMLTGIKGYVSFSLETAEKGSQLHDDLAKASALADRAADLTRQLLAFGRRQTLEPVILDLNHLLEEQIAMERRILGENVDIRFLPSANLGKVRADPGQIEQVLMNLVINSRDAMPKGGRLTIETANMELSKRYAEEHAGVKPGPYVMFAVSDNGCGIDKAQQERIFDPFFTTKDQGKGTGLGLATVYGIVKQHGGNIWVYSEPGKGATFKVYLPRVAGKVEQVAVQQPAVQGGTETVLLVEDEKAVRDIARRFLEGFGYTVLCASCGNEAKDIADRSGGKIALLLTDIVMPDINGRELYEHLAEKHPRMKALYMSGYTNNAVVRDGAVEEGMPFLQKPFDPDKLARKVREVLDKPAD